MIDKIIEFIKPPTDNLYKFKALSGVILIVLGISLWNFYFYLAKLEFNSKSESISALNLKIKELQYSTERLNLQAESLKKKVENNQINFEESQKIRNEVLEIKNELDKNQLQNDAVDEEVTKIRDNKVFTDKSVLISILVLTFSITIHGFFFAFFGFRQWQTKVQNFQDELLELQVKEIKQKLEASNLKKDETELNELTLTEAKNPKNKK